MGATAFLSMWINNTASTSIMLPVTLAILHELHASGRNIERTESISIPIAAINIGNQSFRDNGINSYTCYDM